MASKVIPITNLTQFGVVKDTPTVGLAPNVFTDARNIRFRDMAVSYTHLTLPTKRIV